MRGRKGAGEESAGDSLVAVREDVQQVISDVRRLVHDLRPPALDDLGLVGALREQAQTASAAGLAVTVEADGVTVLPDVVSGGGLASLRERAAELGGSSEVSCPPVGGTPGSAPPCH